MENKTIKDLKDFIDKAMKLGKYPRNTGLGRMAAIKMAEKGLTTEEPITVEYFLDHANELIVRQEDLNLSPASVPVYVARIKSAYSDFKEYGIDPQKLYRWNRPIRQKSTDSTKPRNEKNFDQKNYEDVNNDQNNSKSDSFLLDENIAKDLIRTEIPLSNKRKAILFYPADLNNNDILLLKGQIDFLSLLSKINKNVEEEDAALGT